MQSAGGGFKIHRLHLCRGVIPHSKESLGVSYPKQFDGEALFLKLWGMWSTPSAPLQRGRSPLPNKRRRYDTKQSDGEVPVMLELWRMWSTPLLPSLPDPLRPRVVVSVRVIYMGQIELNWVLGCPRGVMVKAMDCGIVVREFVLQSCYYVHFQTNTLGKGMNPLILQLWVK